MKITDLFKAPLKEYHSDFDDDDRYDRYEPGDDDDGGVGEFTIEEYDGLQPDNAVVSMFDIDVEYVATDMGHRPPVRKGLGARVPRV